jgi:hypothetical protein
MPTYKCFFTPYVGEVDQFIVIEARDDRRACILADGHLADHASYRSVEIFDGERLVGQFQRADAEKDAREMLQ